MYDKAIKGKFDYTLKDTFMGFHCGNTAAGKLSSCEMKFQKIMKRSLEPNGEPDITRGTIEGNIVPGKITFFRLQSTADAQLKAYVAEGEVLPVDPCSFGGIGVFAIPEMGRFYRHVLIEKNYPHHGAVAFAFWKISCMSIQIPWCDILSDSTQPKGMLTRHESLRYLSLCKLFRT